MLTDVIVQLGQAGPLVIGAVGICVALLNQRRQLNAQMFIEFSGRFQQILRMFPTEAWLANRNPSQPLPQPSPQLTECTLYCIQFIADGFHLHKAGYVSKKMWVLWERQIKPTLSGPVFRREWERVATEFCHDEDFVQYIDRIMCSKRRHGSIEAIFDSSAAGCGLGATEAYYGCSSRQ